MTDETNAIVSMIAATWYALPVLILLGILQLAMPWLRLRLFLKIAVAVFFVVNGAFFLWVMYSYLTHA